VYCAAAVCDRPETRALAGLLFCGAGAAFSHLTAARLHGISLRVVDPRVWLSVPAARVVARRPELVVTRSRRLLGWVGSTRGQPVTTLPRTIVDLAQVLDEPELSGALYDVVRREPAIVDRALAAAEGMGGRAGISMLRRVATSFDPTYESAAEARVGVAFAEAGILLTPQVEVWDGWRLVARLDFADEDLLLDVEIDGDRSHGTPAAQIRDRQRDRELRRLGWTVLRFPAADTHTRLRGIVAEVAEHQRALRAHRRPAQ
jgi:hypothetical protein